MKKYFAVIILIFVSTFVFAQVKHTITKSSVTFQIKNMGITINGSIGGTKGEIQFDPAHLDASEMDVSVETNTVNTENDTRDDHLKSDSYFDAAKYPRITIRSVSFKHNSGNNYTGKFNLTIKDKTNPVELPFTYTETGNTGSFKGTLKIKRSDYGIGGKSLILSNDVTILVDVTTGK